MRGPVSTCRIVEASTGWSRGGRVVATIVTPDLIRGDARARLARAWSFGIGRTTVEPGTGPG
jgi:hypothetical protein